MVCVILNAFEYCLPTTFGQYIPHLTPAPVRIPTWPGWKKAFPLRSLPLPDTPSTKLVNITITRTFCCQIICQKSGAVSSPGPGNQIDIFYWSPKSTKGQGIITWDPINNTRNKKDLITWTTVPENAEFSYLGFGKMCIRFWTKIAITFLDSNKLTV